MAKQRLINFGIGEETPVRKRIDKLADKYGDDFGDALAIAVDMINGQNAKNSNRKALLECMMFSASMKEINAVVSKIKSF